MPSMLIRLKVLPEKVGEFEALVSQLVKDIATQEPDPKVYEVRRSQEDPLSYVYFISFEDQAAYDSYANAEYHTAMSPKAIACIDGEPTFENLERFD